MEHIHVYVTAAMKCWRLVSDTTIPLLSSNIISIDDRVFLRTITSETVVNTPDVAQLLTQ